jgi:hypothetical protein
MKTKDLIVRRTIIMTAEQAELVDRIRFSGRYRTESPVMRMLFDLGAEVFLAREAAENVAKPAAELQVAA